MVGGGDHKSFGIPCNDPYGDPVSIEELDEFAREQWETRVLNSEGPARWSGLRVKREERQPPPIAARRIVLFGGRLSLTVLGVGKECREGLNLLPTW